VEAVAVAADEGWAEAAWLVVADLAAVVGVDIPGDAAAGNLPFPSVHNVPGVDQAEENLETKSLAAAAVVGVRTKTLAGNHVAEEAGRQEEAPLASCWASEHADRRKG
jgi:hypothetical protein